MTDPLAAGEWILVGLRARVIERRPGVGAHVELAMKPEPVEAWVSEAAIVNAGEWFGPPPVMPPLTR